MFRVWMLPILKKVKGWVASSGSDEAFVAVGNQGPRRVHAQRDALVDLHSSAVNSRPEVENGAEDLKTKATVQISKIAEACPAASSKMGMTRRNKGWTVP